MVLIVRSYDTDKNRLIKNRHHRGVRIVHTRGARANT